MEQLERPAYGDERRHTYFVPCRSGSYIRHATRRTGDIQVSCLEVWDKKFQDYLDSMVAERGVVSGKA